MKRAQAQRVGRVLLDVAPRVTRLEANRLSALDQPLTHRQYRILHRIEHGMTSSTAISRAAGISLAAVSESVDALCRRGLVAREPDERDRRASRLSLTIDGKAALSSAEATLDGLAARIAADLTADESSALRAGLATVAETVAREHEQMGNHPRAREA